MPHDNGLFSICNKNRDKGQLGFLHFGISGVFGIFGILARVPPRLE